MRQIHQSPTWSSWAGQLHKWECFASLGFQMGCGSWWWHYVPIHLLTYLINDLKMKIKRLHSVNNDYCHEPHGMVRICCSHIYHRQIIQSFVCIMHAWICMIAPCLIQRFGVHAVLERLFSPECAIPLSGQNCQKLWHETWSRLKAVVVVLRAGLPPTSRI
jgi:hypothetical protein